MGVRFIIKCEEAFYGLFFLNSFIFAVSEGIVLTSPFGLMPLGFNTFFMEYKTIKQWAYILHDKDDTRPHYHIYINFGKSSVDTKLVASWFKLGYVNDKGEECTGENFINKVKGRKVDMLQ